jgi:predicted nucleic acid-binding protein
MVVADTSFLVDVLRGHSPAVQLLEELEAAREPIQIPAVALFELHRGLAFAEIHEDERAQIEDVLGSKPILTLDREAAIAGGGVDGELDAAGEPIDPEDSMIAAIARSAGKAVVTANGDHFARVPGLELLEYR